MGIPSLLLLNQEPIGIYIKVDRYIFLEEVCGSEVPASKSGGGGGGLPVHLQIWMIMQEAVMRSIPPRVEI